MFSNIGTTNPTSTSLFGGTTTTQQSGLFGGTTGTSSLFGNDNKQSTSLPSTSLFGNTGGSSLFGGNTGSTGLFDAKSQQSSSLFASSTTPSSNVNNSGMFGTINQVPQNYIPNSLGLPLTTDFLSRPQKSLKELMSQFSVDSQR